MSMRAIMGVISFCLAMTGVILANVFLIMAIGEINRKRDEGNLVSYFGFTYPKLQRICREYRTLYRNGRLVAYMWISFSAAIVGLITVAVCLDIIG